MIPISLKPALDGGVSFGTSNGTLRTGVPLLAELRAASDATPFSLQGFLPCARSSLPILAFPTRRVQGRRQGMQGQWNKAPLPNIFRDSVV